MTTRYLEVTYRHGKPLAAYLYLPRQSDDRSARVAQFPGGLVVDLTEDGRPIGVEILAPATITLDQINHALTQYGLRDLPEEELAPLREAAIE